MPLFPSLLILKYIPHHNEKRYKWLKATSRPELLANGEVIWFGFCLEITKRKVAQIQLSKTEKLFREAQRIARLGNWELDLTNNYLY